MSKSDFGNKLEFDEIVDEILLAILNSDCGSNTYVKTAEILYFSKAPVLRVISNILYSSITDIKAANKFLQEKVEKGFVDRVEVDLINQIIVKSELFEKLKIKSNISEPKAKLKNSKQSKSSIFIAKNSYDIENTTILSLQFIFDIVLSILKK